MLQMGVNVIHLHLVRLHCILLLITLFVCRLFVYTGYIDPGSDLSKKKQGGRELWRIQRIACVGQGFFEEATRSMVKKMVINFK